MKKIIAVLLSVVILVLSISVGGVVTASATGANQKTTLTDLAGNGGLSYTSTRLMDMDSTTGLDTSAMSSAARIDRTDKKQGKGAVSVNVPSAKSNAVLLQTKVGVFDFTVTDPYAQNIKMWVYVSDCDAIACDHDAVYDTPQEDSFTLNICFGNSTSGYNYSLQHTMHGSGWQEIDINFATDNVVEKTRKNINWNFRFLQIRCKTVSGVTVKFDDIRLIQYSTTYQIPECENNGRWISTCDYNALDGGIITEWYGSSFDLDEKSQGTSSLRIDGYPIHVDFRVTFSGMSTQMYYDRDVFCMDMYIDDIKNMSTTFEARIGQNEAGSSDYAYYAFSFGLMNRYANGGEGLKSGWNKLQMPFNKMIPKVCEDYYGEGYRDMIIYKITFFNPATAYTGADAPYTFRYDNLYVTDKSNLDLSFAEEVTMEYTDVEPSECFDKVLVTNGWREVSSEQYDNGKAIHSQNGGNVNFDFIGTELTIDATGKFDVFVDGKKYNFENTFELTGLEEEGHTVKLISHGSSYIDSFRILGQLCICGGCGLCGERTTETVLLSEQKAVSDMQSTLQNTMEDFSIINTQDYGAPDDCAKTAYMYETKYGAPRKSGFAIKTPSVLELAGNEENWTVDTWVYISDVTSYQVILQLIPYGGLTYESIYEGSYFSNLTENWAYRLKLFNNVNEADKSEVKLTAGWNHLQIPLSDFISGEDENKHTDKAFEVFSQSHTLSGITVHENNSANYGKYDFAIASFKLVNNGDHTCYIEEKADPEYIYYEAEKNLDNLRISNKFVNVYNNNLSGRNALRTADGGKVKVSFFGEAFSIVSYKSPSQGKMYVSIDGAEEIEVDLYAEKADTYFKETVFEHNSFNEKRHIISIRTEGKVVIDSFGIDGEMVACIEPIRDTVSVEAETMITAEYSGNYSKVYSWYLSGRNAVKMEDGALVKFDFDGEEFSLISYKAKGQGKMYVTIDDNQEVEIDLSDESVDTLYQQTVYSVSNLTYGTHSAVIRVEGTAIFDSIVIRRNLYEPLNVEAESGKLTFSGNWSKTYAWPLSEHYAMFTSNGGSVTFNYTGYDFRIISYKATTQGKMFVSIDGGEEIEVDLYDVTTDTRYKEQVFEAAGLPLARHSITVRTEGKVVFDAVKVDGKLN